MHDSVYLGRIAFFKNDFHNIIPIRNLPLQRSEPGPGAFPYIASFLLVYGERRRAIRGRSPGLDFTKNEERPIPVDNIYLPTAFRAVVFSQNSSLPAPQPKSGDLFSFFPYLRRETTFLPIRRKAAGSPEQRVKTSDDGLEQAHIFLTLRDASGFHIHYAFQSRIGDIVPRISS